MLNPEKGKKLRTIFNAPFLKFLLIGGVSTGIDYVIYSALIQYIPVTFSKLCSMLCSTFFSFLINKNWTFQSREQNWFESLRKYYLAQIANISVNVLMNTLLFSLTKNKTAAFIGATAIAMSINFLLQRFYVFKKKL